MRQLFQSAPPEGLIEVFQTCMFVERGEVVRRVVGELLEVIYEREMGNRLDRVVTAIMVVGERVGRWCGGQRGGYWNVEG